MDQQQNHPKKWIQGLKEPRPVRVQIYVSHSMKEKLEEAKRVQRASANEIINQILEENIEDYI